MTPNYQQHNARRPDWDLVEFEFEPRDALPGYAVAERPLTEAQASEFRASLAEHYEDAP